jgi:hypothetical protein
MPNAVMTFWSAEDTNSNIAKIDLRYNDGNGRLNQAIYENNTPHSVLVQIHEISPPFDLDYVIPAGESGTQNIPGSAKRAYEIIGPDEISFSEDIEVRVIWPYSG